MSNTAAPNRTEVRFPVVSLATVRTVLGAAVLLVLLVTFTPFQSENEIAGAATDTGNVVNQIGYAGLGLLALVSQILFVDPRVSRALLRPTWLVMAGFLLLSAGQAIDPQQGFRTALFGIMAMISAAAVLTLPPGRRAFHTVLIASALVVLGLCYAGILLLPGLAIHQADGVESLHGGLWRGLYSHKNTAAPVIAAMFFAGLYLMRDGRRRIGLLVALLSAVFVLNTGSKTSTALVPAVALLVAGGRFLGGPKLPVAIVLLAVVGMALMTLGAALVPALDDVLQSILPGTTFTGRMDLWRFALDTMEPRQWTGYGPDSFWLTNNVFSAETPHELSWDPRGIVNAHSGYLDIAISMGWPALVVASLMLVVLPLADYCRCGQSRQNERLADLFLMILAFALLNSFLESYFFRRADPVWMLTFIAVVGLRLASKFRVPD